MIKPTALWNLAHECEEQDAENLGKVLLYCAGKAVSLDRAWTIQAKIVEKDAADLDERVEEKRTKERERKRSYRAASGSAQPADESQDVPRDTTGQDGTQGDNAVSRTIHTHIHTHPHTHTPLNNNNRSVTVTVPKLENENGTGLSKNVERFRAALRGVGEGVFFDAGFDPVAIAVYITGDDHSVRRWREAMNNIGEGKMRDELFAFYREIANGEEPDNRGAALNARLIKIEKEGK